MTKEELEQEAEEFTDSKKSFWRQGRTCIDSVKQAYIAGAEPREKRIAALEDTNKKISDECHKLVDSLEKKQNEVVELQHLIKTQDRKLRQQSKVCDEAIDRVETLVKENTELKKELRDKKCNDKDCPVFIKLVQANKTRVQLTKAKELLRMIIDSYNHKERFSFEKDLMKAEQFLK